MRLGCPGCSGLLLDRCVVNSGPLHVQQTQSDEVASAPTLHNGHAKQPQRAR